MKAILDASPCEGIAVTNLYDGISSDYIKT